MRRARRLRRRRAAAAAAALRRRRGGVRIRRRRRLGDALGDASRCIESRRTKKFSCSRPGESAAPPPLRAASGTTRVGETSSAHTWWRGGSPGGGARGEDGWLVPFAGAPRGAGRGSRGGIGGAAPAAAFALLPPDESADVRVADVDVPPVGCLAGEATRSLSTRSRSSISSDELTFLTSALRSDIMKSRFKAYCCAEASSSLRTRLPPSTSQCPFLSGGSVKEDRFSSAFSGAPRCRPRMSALEHRANTLGVRQADAILRGCAGARLNFARADARDLGTFP